MSWAALAANQWVPRNDLQDAVTTGVFFLRPSQSIPAGTAWVTRTEVETWIFASVTSGAANQWPQKSWIVPIATTTTTTTLATTTTTSSTTTTTTTLPPTTTTTTTAGAIDPTGTVDLVGINNITYAGTQVIEGFVDFNNSNGVRIDYSGSGSITKGNTRTLPYTWDNTDGFTFNNATPITSIFVDLDSITSGQTITATIRHNGVIKGVNSATSSTSVTVPISPTIYVHNGDTIEVTVEGGP